LKQRLSIGNEEKNQCGFFQTDHAAQMAVLRQTGRDRMFFIDFASLFSVIEKEKEDISR
jgi:hypothetical protein